MKKYLLLLLVMNGYLSKAQNNAIFNGGNADGWSRSGFTQAGNNIFNGGNGGGWHYNGFTQSINNIFSGGNGDGWSFAAFAQAGNGIFNGGAGDGWNYALYLQAGNNIFVGGGGDGWASTYRPLGALPVVFVSFTAEKQGRSSLLKWQTAKEDGTAYFDVERSADAVHFQNIGNVAAAGNSTTSTPYNYVDAQPLVGYNYYRLKQVDKSGTYVYTPTRMLIFDASTLQALKAYPVPAVGLVTLELPPQINNDNAVVNVSNAIGVMVQQIKLPKARADNKKVLNINGLPAGVYTVQVWSQSFSGSVTIIKQ